MVSLENNTKSGFSVTQGNFKNCQAITNEAFGFILFGSGSNVSNCLATQNVSNGFDVGIMWYLRILKHHSIKTKALIYMSVIILSQTVQHQITVLMDSM